MPARKVDRRTLLLRLRFTPCEHRPASRTYLESTTETEERSVWEEGKDADGHILRSQRVTKEVPKQYEITPGALARLLGESPTIVRGVISGFFTVDMAPTPDDRHSILIYHGADNPGEPS